MPTRFVLIVLTSAALQLVITAQQPPFSVVEATIADMQAAMQQKRITSRGIVQQYLDRIAKYEDRLNAIITLNPRALDEADQRDRERAQGKIRGPLHGIPIALKDNIHTTDMQTIGRRAGVQGVRSALRGDGDEDPSRRRGHHRREDQHDGAGQLDCDRHAGQLQRPRRLWFQSLRRSARSARGHQATAGRRCRPPAPVRAPAPPPICGRRMSAPKRPDRFCLRQTRR